jgi:hypothetical protein
MKSLITIMSIGLMAFTLFGCQSITNPGARTGAVAAMALPELLIHAHN